MNIVAIMRDNLQSEAHLQEQEKEYGITVERKWQSLQYIVQSMDRGASVALQSWDYKVEPIRSGKLT